MMQHLSLNPVFIGNMSEGFDERERLASLLMLQLPHETSKTSRRWKSERVVTVAGQTFNMKSFMHVTDQKSQLSKPTRYNGIRLKDGNP